MKSLKTRFKLLFVLCIFFSVLLLPNRIAEAADNLLPTAVDNLSIGLKRTSDFVATGDGYMRVYYNGARIGVEYYDDDFVIKSKRFVEMELSMWGGFYAGSDGYYYVVEGQPNLEERDTAEVIRVIKYNSSWMKVGTAVITGNTEIFGGEVRCPFDVGCVEMAEYKGMLYIVTGHEGYVDPAVNRGHQGFLMIAVNKETMTGKIVVSDLWHSFAQYIACKDSNLYVLEQSEGSRCTTLTKYDAESLESTTMPVLEYGGSRDSVWAIDCYASVNGMAISSDNVLGIGTSIDQSKYDNVTSDTAHNIYLTVTPLSNFTEEATTVKWITNYSGGGKSFLGVKITRVNDNRFMISWEEYGTGGMASTDDSLSASILHYVFVDGNGDKISREFTEATPISDCQPIVKNSNVVYYASNANMVNFYSIDANTGKTNKKSYRTAGENATWDFHNGILTISGTGEISVDAAANFRYPVSSAGGGYVSYGSDNAWKAIRDHVKKIVIKKGITGISENAFMYFDKLEEVEIEEGVTSIGKQAFSRCSSLEKITIPESVTNIGEDILWTGYYWMSDESHVTYATICAKNDSCAIDYARKNRISYCISILDAEITGLKESYEYNGKAQEPEITVTLGSETLEKGEDYSVTYTNNEEVGTATVEITGINNYEGKITKEFKINLPNKGTELTDSKTENIYSVTENGTAVAFKESMQTKKTTVTIPSTVRIDGITYKVTSVAANAFKNNKKLKKVTISGNVTSIGKSAFQGCTALQTVKIGNKVTTIGSKAFYGCKKLTNVTLGKKVRTIGSSAFANCTSITKLTFPSMIEKIGSKAFYNCRELLSVTVQSDQLASKNIGDKAFTNVGKSNYKKLTVKVPKNKVKQYKKLFKKKGLSSKAKIKK